MKDKTVHVKLNSSYDESSSREFKMSIDLYQNARLTMGEVRDMLRVMGVSWDFIQNEIQNANQTTTLNKIFNKMDDYTTGIGKTLHDKDSNVR